jgi:hypothetical protein
MSWDPTHSACARPPESCHDQLPICWHAQPPVARTVIGWWRFTSTRPGRTGRRRQFGPRSVLGAHRGPNTAWTARPAYRRRPTSRGCHWGRRCSARSGHCSARQRRHPIVVILERVRGTAGPRHRGTRVTDLGLGNNRPRIRRPPPPHRPAGHQLSQGPDGACRPTCCSVLSSRQRSTGPDRWYRALTRTAPGSSPSSTRSAPAYQMSTVTAQTPGCRVGPIQH